MVLSRSEYSPSKEQWMELTLTVGRLELSKRIRGVWLSDGLWQLHVDGHIVNIKAQPMHYSNIARLLTATAGKFLCKSGFPSRRDDGLSRLKSVVCMSFYTKI